MDPNQALGLKHAFVPVKPSLWSRDQRVRQGTKLMFLVFLQSKIVVKRPQVYGGIFPTNV